MFEEPSDTSLLRPPSSQNKLSPPSSQNLQTSQQAADKNMDKVFPFTTSKDPRIDKSMMRPAGSMSISSLLGRDDAPSTPQPRGSNFEYRHSSTYAKSSSTDYTHPYLTNAISFATRPEHIRSRRTRTPDNVKHSLAVSSKRKQPQSATSPTTTNTNGQASPWDTAHSSGPDRRSYSPLTPNASVQSNLNRENRNKTYRTGTPLSMKQIREPLKSPSPLEEREGRTHTLHIGMNHEHASLSGNCSGNELAQKLYGRNENGLDKVRPQTRSLLNLSDDQRYETQSLKMNQGNGTDYWTASERASADNNKFAAKNELYEKNVFAPKGQAVQNVLNTTPVGNNNGDHKGSLRRERNSTINQIQVHSNDNNSFLRGSEASWLSASPARGYQRSRNMFSDGASRKLEELPHHKILAGITSENNKKTGRASPLPQAVQGAQAQPAGPGGNPSIKNEFGRMFSGLGSGLSSAPPNNGITSPRLSPLPQRPHDGVESAPPHSNVNVESLKLTRTGSYPSGKIRRMKEDDSFPNGNSDGRSSLLAVLEQGVKRNKNTHPSHHHHHPPLSHQ